MRSFIVLLVLATFSSLQAEVRRVVIYERNFPSAENRAIGRVALDRRPPVYIRVMDA